MIQSLANYAANHQQFPFPSLHSACSSQRTAEVMELSTEEGEGTNYILTLSVSAIFGSSSDMVLTSTCHNVVIFRPLAASCQGEVSSCAQMVNPGSILCRRGSKRGELLRTCISFFYWQALDHFPDVLGIDSISTLIKYLYIRFKALSMSKK